METELFKMLYGKLILSGLSKRNFALQYGLSHAWFIEFINPNKAFRPLQVKTMSILVNNLGIPLNACHDYNAWVEKERSK